MEEEVVVEVEMKTETVECCCSLSQSVVDPALFYSSNSKQKHPQFNFHFFGTNHSLKMKIPQRSRSSRRWKLWGRKIHYWSRRSTQWRRHSEYCTCSSLRILSHKILHFLKINLLQIFFQLFNKIIRQNKRENKTKFVRSSQNEDLLFFLKFQFRQKNP
jgi:hypothetical protein